MLLLHQTTNQHLKLLAFTKFRPELFINLLFLFKQFR